MRSSLAPPESRPHYPNGKALTVVGSVFALACAAASACAIPLDGGADDLASSQPVPSFVDDAGADAPDSTFELTNYCPSSKCQSDRTTCPSSRFPCDVDLRSDPNNCGSCGFVCPKEANGAVFACVEGKCQMACNAGPPPKLDCNGIVDDGCEIIPTTNENCGGCGIKCTDPANGCSISGLTGLWGCGCITPDIPCKQGDVTVCIDPTKDDNNCGACGNACDPNNGGAPSSYPGTYYGCEHNQCGQLKCQQGFDDCNGEREDGCETFLMTAENCGGCGNACPAGQGCYLNQRYEPECMCPPGKTLCFRFGLFGSCVDITSDPNNCGGCNAACPGGSFDKFLYPVCRNGSCETACQTGHADCNGNREDGCEINADSDPRNCGGCGRACDAVAGQACIGGRCAVEPCRVDAGETTR